MNFINFLTINFCYLVLKCMQLHVSELKIKANFDDNSEMRYGHSLYEQTLCSLIEEAVLMRGRRGGQCMFYGELIPQ